MRRLKQVFRTRTLGVFFSAGVVFQLGGCEFGEITVTQTMDGRDVLINLVRGAVLGPIDSFITAAINQAFDEEE